MIARLSTHHENSDVYECSTALPQSGVVRDSTAPNTDDQDFFWSQDSFQRTPFKTRRVSAACVVKQLDFIGFLSFFHKVRPLVHTLGVACTMV